MLKVFDATPCNLGEGIYIDQKYNYIYWLDINKNVLLYKNLDIGSELRTINLDVTPSVIFTVTNGIITLLDAIGILSLNLTTLETKRITKFNHDPLKFRGNDGVLTSDGTYLFGSMERNPNSVSGAIYSSNLKDVLILDNIGIPNTFIELNNVILISDSLEQRIYSYCKNTFEKLNVWLDFSDTSMTPDGGCVTPDNRIFIAFWDGACVKEFDETGLEINTIPIPALKPTNCKYHKNGFLIVTTAREGMTVEQLRTYPKSGQTFHVGIF